MQGYGTCGWGASAHWAFSHVARQHAPPPIGVVCGGPATSIGCACRGWDVRIGLYQAGRSSRFGLYRGYRIARGGLVCASCGGRTHAHQYSDTAVIRARAGRPQMDLESTFLTARAQCQRKKKCAQLLTATCSPCRVDGTCGRGHLGALGLRLPVGGWVLVVAPLFAFSPPPPASSPGPSLARSPPPLSIYLAPLRPLSPPPSRFHPHPFAR